MNAQGVLGDQVRSDTDRRQLFCWSCCLIGKCYRSLSLWSQLQPERSPSLQRPELAVGEAAKVESRRRSRRALAVVSGSCCSQRRSTSAISTLGHLPVRHRCSLHPGCSNGRQPGAQGGQPPGEVAYSSWRSLFLLVHSSWRLTEGVRSRESACLQCAFTTLAAGPKTTKTDKKHGSQQESHPLSDRPAIDWPCRI